MDGYGYNADLPESLNKTFDNVWIFHGNLARDNGFDGGLGVWEQLKPGHGAEFSSTNSHNKLSERFGIELSFAAALQQKYPNDKIAIIKYSCGGTSLDSVAESFGNWEPDYHGKYGINQYDHFLTTLRNANRKCDIDGDGINDNLVPQGIVWMQGESDAENNKEVALRYYDNLSRLMDLIRAALLVDDLPVVLGEISDSGNADDGHVWDYLEIVQQAQAQFVASDKHAALVTSTRNYSYSDRYHYNSEGFIDLGEKFAEALIFLIENQ